ncbi:Adenosine deaminase [Lachnospiraceae bacterium XBB1006]|nr:Adenosine deaminase [Lachnospiraceae bacterium XBB1006]
MTYFSCFYLDNEKDIVVNLYKDKERLYYVLSTPNHGTGNLIRNLAAVCALPLTKDEKGMLQICGEIPCYIDGNNEETYIFRLKDVEIARIDGEGNIEMHCAIPAIAKTLMSQTKDYPLDIEKTIFKTTIRKELKFRGDLHTHMNGNLPADVLIALGICHQIRYPLYYVRKLELELTKSQWEAILTQRKRVERQFTTSELTGKYLDRKINDNTFINFADLILNNLNHAAENIRKIRGSLAILKDGQAVFTNLEKVYLYRYVFAKGKKSEEPITIHSVDMLPDADVKRYVKQMLRDKENPDYADNTIFQDKLLWIARNYKKQGVCYAEISDTTLVKQAESVEMLCQVHEVMPKIYRETGVMIRFLAAMRRIPLTIIKDAVTPENYLEQNIAVLKVVACDPYVAGCDFVGEEINDIIELKPFFRGIVEIAAQDPSFVIRIHAGENDSQKDNIAHSIACVKESLTPGQPMPRLRLGHGLYTYSFSTKKGAEVLRELKDLRVVLEFQITSNVRLNNLNSLSKHPLKRYLQKGIFCVQGTDGAALYGTTSMDEQLSLEKMLELSEEEVRHMKETESRIIKLSMQDFYRKQHALEGMLGERDLEGFFLDRMKQIKIEKKTTRRVNKVYASKELKEQVKEISWERTPIVLMGGSFNTRNRPTRVTEEGISQVNALLDSMNPEEVCFVIGHTLSGYEKYLLEHNEKGFQVYAIVPSLLSERECENLKQSKVFVRVSTESEAMGIYKSFNYEIFERRPSVVVAFDGNSAGENLIQEAKNGKGKSIICIFKHSKTLRHKAESLQGYVQIFDKEMPIMESIKEGQKRHIKR